MRSGWHWHTYTSLDLVLVHSPTLLQADPQLPCRVFPIILSCCPSSHPSALSPFSDCLSAFGSYIHIYCHIYTRMCIESYSFQIGEEIRGICCFWVWFILPHSDIQIHPFPKNIRISFSSMAEWNSLVQWTMFLHSSVDGPLGWPRILAVTSRAAVKCLAVLDQRFSLGFDTIQILPESSSYLPASKGASFRCSSDPAHWLSFSMALAEP